MTEGIELTDGTTTSKKKLWQERVGMIQALRTDPESFVRELRFDNHKGVAVACIDERVQKSKLSCEMQLLCLPGSGILLGSNPEDSLRKAVKLLHGKVHMITWHKGCGAASEAKDRFGLDGDVDDIAREFAEELARRLGVLCRELELCGPVGFHFARGVIYDGTGRLQMSRRFPEMFVVSRELIGNVAIAQNALEMAYDIAMGHHAFGELFSQQPFQIILLGYSNIQLDQLMGEVSDLKIHGDDVETHRVLVPLT